MNAITLTERDSIGANNPPVELTPFDAHKVNIDDLFDEAKNWADGEPIETQEQADTVQVLMRQIQEAEKAADVERVKENEPFDLGKAAVQAKYAPLIANTKAVKGKTVLAIEALKKHLQPWLIKLEEARQAEAKRLRDEAETAQKAAAEAARAARDANDLQATEDAEVAITEARQADRAATNVEKARPQASGYGRAASLRDNWIIKGFAAVGEGDDAIEGETALLRHYWATNRPALIDAALVIARAEVAAGKRTLPGLVIVNEPKVV